MLNTAPYEIVAAPFEVWLAAVGSTFPSVEDAPGDPWALLGTSGNLNYDEAGVSVKHPQKVDLWKALGSTGPRKAFRTDEELQISLKLVDISLEQYKRVLNDNTVSTTVAAGHTSGFKTLGLSRGLTVVHFALLVRGAGASGYGADWNTQYEVPVAIQMGQPDPVYTKGKPAELACEFVALEDPSASSPDQRFGRLIMQHQDPIS